MKMLTEFVTSFPYENTVVGVIPTPGLREFYERHGYESQPPDAPAMYRWTGGTTEQK